MVIWIRGEEKIGEEWKGGGTYNRPTAKMASTPILRLVGILSLEMR